MLDAYSILASIVIQLFCISLLVRSCFALSNACRGLHISEDVFSGYNHVLRGGKVKFQEFMEAGKGRDNGFDGINGFAAKVGGEGRGCARINAVGEAVKGVHLCAQRCDVHRTCMDLGWLVHAGWKLERGGGVG